MDSLFIKICRTVLCDIPVKSLVSRVNKKLAGKGVGVQFGGIGKN